MPVRKGGGIPNIMGMGGGGIGIMGNGRNDCGGGSRTLPSLVSITGTGGGIDLDAGRESPLRAPVFAFCAPARRRRGC